MNQKPPLTAINYVPADIRCAQDYERLASQFIDAATYAYIAGGSDKELTLQDNRSAFSLYRIVPRVLCDVTRGTLETTLLARRHAHPIMLAPVAHQKLVHPEAERATALGASVTESIFISSTLSSEPLEVVAKNAGEYGWFQIYFQDEKRHTADLLKRAELAGFKAIVVTVDAAIQAPGISALQAGFKMPDGIPINLARYHSVEPNSVDTNKQLIFSDYMRHAPNWADIEWLLAETQLPVFIKGILHSQDAKKAKSIGAHGVIVSNHGGRTLDGVASSLSCLASIREAVGEDYPILFDGGVRSGGDIFKAIALGANSVLIGRLQVYALAVAGALGVAHLLRLLGEELELQMAMAGCASIADIKTTTLMSKASLPIFLDRI